MDVRGSWWLIVVIENEWGSLVDECSNDGGEGKSSEEKKYVLSSEYRFVFWCMYISET